MSHPHHTEPQYLGVPIFFAGKTWLVPALSVRQFQTNLEILTTPIAGDDKESWEKRFALCIPLIGMALRRNYPEITDLFLEDHLDLNTFGQAFKAVQAASSLKAVSPGEFETQTAT